MVVCVNYVWFSVRTKESWYFFFRSSTNKQQQRFFLKENHLFRINLGGCLCLNSVWFSVSIIEELVVCFRLLFGSGGFSTPYLIICFPVFQPSRRRRRRRSILILQLRTRTLHEKCSTGVRGSHLPHLCLLPTTLKLLRH